MHEIAALADTCSVFRNGRHVETFAHGARTDQEIVRLMIGRDIAQVYPPKPRRDAPRDALPRGQRPGLGRPAGRPDLRGRQGRDRRPGRARRPGPARADAGAVRRAARRRGQRPDRRPARTPPRSPAHAKAPACGMALVPEDRKTEGLLLPMAVRDNLSLAALGQPRAGWASSTARPRSRAVDEMVRAAAHQARRAERPGRHAVGRQPAEGGDRQVADDPAAADPAQRPDPRHRRRHQAGALRA